MIIEIVKIFQIAGPDKPCCRVLFTVYHPGETTSDAEMTTIRFNELYTLCKLYLYSGIEST